jgi:transaldolase
MTNPPATNEAIERMNKQYTRTIDKFPPKHVMDEITQKVDQAKLEAKLMEEGVAKFAEPQHALLRLIAQKRASLATAR